MPLVDKVVHLRDLILVDLDAVHDYYVNAQAAWQTVQSYVDRGGRMRVRNLLTRNVTTEQDLPGKARLYVRGYLTASTFQQFVSLFEDFVFGLLRHWLLAFPQRLGKKQLPVSVVFAATDLEAVKRAAIDRELHELSYKKVRDWFTYLEDLVKLGCPSADEIDRLAEIKASRDVLVHNRGVAGAPYVEKAGNRKRCEAGEQLEVPAHYHRDSWQLLRKVVADVSAAAIARAP